MSNMKCPFCQTELEINDLDVQLLGCENQNCKHSTHYDTVGTKELWEALIQTKQDLEIAIEGIKTLGEYDPYKEHLGIDTIAQNILEQIEKKDK